MSQLFTSAGQNIGVSASTSVLPMNMKDWFSLGWTGWISLKFKGLSRVFSSTTIWKHQFVGAQPSLWSNSQVATVVKNPPTNAGNVRKSGSIPGLEKYPGVGNGNPLHYSCLENPMDRGAWQPTVHRCTKSWTLLKQLSMHACSYPHMTTKKKHSFDYMHLCHKVMSLRFKTLSRFVRAFLSWSKHLLISRLQSLSTVILEPKKRKSVTVSIFFPFICHEVMKLDAIFLFFGCWVLSQLFNSLLSPSSRGSLVLLHFLSLVWCHLHIWGYWYLSQQPWL